MGAGHDGAARELQSRLERAGHRTRIVDFLDCCPRGVGWFLKWSYQVQLRYAAWSYELMYRLWYLLPTTWGSVVWLDTKLAGRGLRKAVKAFDADVVVSTYPLSSLVLGNMRRKKWLRVPVVTFLTDFAVHPLWVHPSVDLHLAVAPSAANMAAQRTKGGATRASGPLVGERFRRREPHTRDDARRALGLPPDARAVLVVAGSWGVGDVISTVEHIVAAGDYHPVTVCGRDEKLKIELEARGLGTVIGWTDDMPALMAGCDAMVENAGGLTAMEAFASGLPVVTYHPIAGHGRDNARFMAESGVSHYARGEDDLGAALQAATTPGSARDAQIRRGEALFASDPSADVIELSDYRQDHGVAKPIVPPNRTRRWTAGMAASLLFVYGGLTLGAQGVAAVGVGVARAPTSAHGAVYVGVRLDAEELADRSVGDALARLDASAVVDGRTARLDIGALRRLSASGVDVANGGWGRGRPFRYLRAENDVAHAGDLMRRESGVRVATFVPERRLDAFDQLWCRRRHQKLVEPDAILRPAKVPQELEARKVYVLDGRGSSTGALLNALDELSSNAAAARLTVTPLSRLT